MSLAIFYNFMHPGQQRPHSCVRRVIWEATGTCDQIPISSPLSLRWMFVTNLRDSLRAFCALMRMEQREVVMTLTIDHQIYAVQMKFKYNFEFQSLYP